MLSIKSLGTANSGISKYYEHLGADDYYTQGGEPPGRWDGRLAGALALSGNVRPGQLQKLFEGCHPISGESMAKNAGADHKAGWDCTFSAPKSVSVAWALADNETQKQIADAHDQAVSAALGYLERNAFASRDRHGDSPLQSIIAATFQHSTSREMDPQLHTHCAIANLGLRADGSVCALDLDSRWKMAAGAVYRAELAKLMQQQGFEIDRDGKSFRLAAVPDELCKQFSKRRQQIESYLDEHGYDSAKAANVAALATRKAKESPNRAILQQQWQREAADAGYMPEAIAKMYRPMENQEEAKPALDIPSILQGLTQNESFFTRQQLEAAIATECQGIYGASEIPGIVHRAVREGLKSQELAGLVKLEASLDQQKSRRKAEIYTTREMLELERRAIDAAITRKMDRSHAVALDGKLLEGLSDEQANAVRHIVQESGSVACVRGLAGTGKSYMLARARHAWEAEGFELVGCALAGKAADGLETGSGIQSQTLHSLLTELESNEKSLSKKSIVVLDEAGMVGTRQMSALINHVQKTGAKLVLVGDHQQLQSIEAGGLFKGISDAVGHAELVDIRRQQSQDDRETIKKLIDAKAAEVVQRLDDAGQLKIEKDDLVAGRMVDDWLENRNPRKPGESLMLAGTRAEVRQLNTLARAKLLDSGRLHSEVTVVGEHGERSFFVGERICFGRNSRQLGVKNGQLGTLEKWSLDARSGSLELSIRMDSGEVVSVDPERYQHFDTGFAMSVHKAQGVTADKVSVLVSEQMTDLEWSYVAVSRHRERLRVFVPASMDEGLERGLSRSRQKTMANSLIKKELSMEL